MAGPNTRAKTNVDTTIYQAAQDYLQSNAFLKAVEVAVERGISKQLSKLFERIEKLEESTAESKERLEQNAGSLMDLDVQIREKTDQIEKLNSVIEKQAVSLNNLKLEMNEIQQYSRRNCLKIYGVPENKGENTDKVVCSLASEHLDIILTEEDLDRSHRVANRVGQNSSSNAEGANSKKKKPRAIIVKFCSYRKRSAILRARRLLKGTGMAIDEALTASNQDLLWTAKRHEKVKEAWTSDGHVTVLLASTSGKDIKRVIRNKDELKLLK